MVQPIMAGQIQPNGVSVQEVLEKALSTILRSVISITGAGRTDAGVHGRMMVAHFDTEQAFDCGQLVYKVNRLLPRDISVSKIELSMKTFMLVSLRRHVPIITMSIQGNNLSRVSILVSCVIL